jgi:hypothetical protein
MEIQNTQTPTNVSGTELPSGEEKTDSLTLQESQESLKETASKRKYMFWEGLGAFRAEKGGLPSFYKALWRSPWIKITGREPKDLEIVAFKFYDQSIWDIQEGWN